MGAGQKNFHKRFARVSPVFVAALLALVCVPSAVSAPLSTSSSAENNAADATTNVRKAASTQFAKAEQMRAALGEKPAAERTLAEYKQVALAYRRVALITPRAPEVPESLVALGEVYTEMGDRFGRTYYQSAVDSYLFLAHEYPGSRYCPDALLRAAKLQRDELSEAREAQKTYGDFLKRYPRSARKHEVQQALAELALLESDTPDGKPDTPRSAASDGRAAEAKREPTADTGNGSRAEDRDASGGAPSESGAIPRVRRIRAEATAQSTRVTIDLEDSVQYTSARISHPDRIFFDLHAARLTPELMRGSIHVEGNLLSAVRVAQNQVGVVRVVLDVSGVKDYTTSLTHNPAQLLIDLYPNPAIATAQARPPSFDTLHNQNPAPAMTRNGEARNVRPVAERKADANPPESTDTVASTGTTARKSRNDISEAEDAPADSARASRSKSAKAAGSGGKPDLARSASAAAPTRDGNSTLTRVLGLKIGRIVIDPGHGGHDTGTIGPTGLMEKDLCLDIALRLEKIIQQRLPGAEVLLTRSDDTFIPLEERTEIANRAKADLFISIHANSSQDHAARGVETYYLNLKGSAEAMEVAARENASSQQGIHDLQDLVKRITQTEKIDESKEFAQDVQGSLSQRIQKVNRTVKNRGIRKAPFVVLIGADMPSILTEISFLSNPSDEQLLKKPEHRQRVAEGIYQGVAAYLQSLNSVTLNLPPRSGAAPRGTGGASRAVEQSRNQN